MNLETLIADSTNKVESEKHTAYWTANGYKFDNKLLALWYETATNNFVTFVDTQLDQIRENLSSPIDMEKDYNLDYLQYLRQEYDKVHLMFSGGADCLTILDMAIENNLLIDNLICFTCDSIELENNREIKYCALPVINQYKGKYGSYEIVSTTWDDHCDAYTDEMRFFKQTATHTNPFNSAWMSGHIWYQLKKNNCYIKGADKPQLLKYNNRWYAINQDSSSIGDWKNPDVKAFWLDAQNIKSYVKDAILYRQHLLESDSVDNSSLQFFKPGQDQQINSILGRSKVHNHDQQLGKHKTDSSKHCLPISKGLQRMKDALSVGRMDVLVNYFSAMKKFNTILPEYAYKNIPGKFAWFIDIDSLEVFTQEQLIPNGFQGV